MDHVITGVEIEEKLIQSEVYHRLLSARLKPYKIVVYQLTPGQAPMGLDQRVVTVSGKGVATTH